MKDLSLSAVGVVVLALVLGLLFRWLYPRVEMTAELGALFALAALVLRLLLAKAWALWRKDGANTGAKP